MSSTPSKSSSNDKIAIVGCGVLGTSLCKQLLSHPDFANRSIIGITKSTNRHDAILEQILGSSSDDNDEEQSSRFQLLTMDSVVESQQQYTDVVFCAPPSGFDDYPTAVEEAATQLWSGAEGSFVFTSSGGVYEGLDGEIVTELSSTIDPIANPRQGRMIYAEQHVIELGGCALRLAGLYTLERGAHNYWLEKCSESGIQGREDGIVNLLHYDDAASAVLAALQVGHEVNSKETYLISDGHPTTRRGICESALKHERYSTRYTKVPPFLGKKEDGLLGKIYDGSKSNQELKWKPTYKSFDEFMTNN